MFKIWLEALAGRVGRLSARALVAKFTASKGGNVAVISGIAALPIISAVGCVVDYSMASMIRTKLQAAADAAALAAAARQSGARLVYLSNPDNPTGSWLGRDEQLALIAGLPPGAVLILDEAYADFAPPDTLPLALICWAAAMTGELAETAASVAASAAACSLVRIIEAIE